MLKEYKNLANNSGLQGGEPGVHYEGGGSDREAVMDNAEAEFGKGLNDDDDEEEPAETTLSAFVASNLHKEGTHGSCKLLRQGSRKSVKREPCGVGYPPRSFAELVQGHAQGCFVSSGQNIPFQQNHQTCPTHKDGTEAYKKAHGLKKRTPAKVPEVKVEVSKDELSKLIMVGSSSRRRFRKSAEPGPLG